MIYKKLSIINSCEKIFEKITANSKAEHIEIEKINRIMLKKVALKSISNLSKSKNL